MKKYETAPGKQAEFVKLYQWQKDCLDAWERNQFRGIVDVVTGAGKTLLAIAAYERLRRMWQSLRVRIVVPTIPLAQQWQTVLLHHASQEEWRPGFFGGERKDDPDRRVMIYIINSARGSLAKHIRQDMAAGRHVLLICDECHRYQSKENQKIFSFLPPAPEGQNAGFPALYSCMGLSATPFGTGNDSLLRRSLGDAIYHYSFDQAAQEGIISNYTVCEVSASFLPEELEKYCELSDEISVLYARLITSSPSLKELGKNAFMKVVTQMARKADMDPSDPAAAFLIGTYQRRQVTNLAAARTLCAARLIREQPPGTRCLVFGERIEQAQMLSAILSRNAMIRSGIYHSGMTKDARKRVMQEFRDRRFSVLISCRCLDEGIDVPDASVAIIMSSSSVDRQRIQRLGRIIRKADSKDSACLYYIYIRESTDDAAYLKGLEEARCLSLRFYSAEEEFANDLYEYVSGELLQKARDAGFAPEQLAELRRCLLEGLIRPDYLLPAAVQKKNAQQAENRHLRNYWTAMRKIGGYFAPRQTS